MVLTFKKSVEKLVEKELLNTPIKLQTVETKPSDLYLILDIEFVNFFYYDETILQKLYQDGKLEKDYKHKDKCLTQICYVIFNDDLSVFEVKNMYVQPEQQTLNKHIPGYRLRRDYVVKDDSEREGVDLKTALSQFDQDLKRCNLMISHGLDQDYHVIRCEYYRCNMDHQWLDKINHFCTMTGTKHIVQVYNKIGRLKDPTKEELYYHLFNKRMPSKGNHNAIFDVKHIFITYIKFRFNRDIQDMLDQQPEIFGEQIKKLDGEDLKYGNNALYIDLVPTTSWFENLGSAVSSGDQIRLNQFVCQRAGNKCEICKKTDQLEVHPRFSYDKNIQTLKRLIGVCQDCYRVIHYDQSNDQQAFQHMLKVSGLSPEKCQKHIDSLLKIHQSRSQRIWRLDLGLLSRNGIQLLREDEPEELPNDDFDEDD